MQTGSGTRTFNHYGQRLSALVCFGHVDDDNTLIILSALVCKGHRADKQLINKQSITMAPPSHVPQCSLQLYLQ